MLLQGFYAGNSVKYDFECVTIIDFIIQFPHNDATSS